MPTSSSDTVARIISARLSDYNQQGEKNLTWLKENMSRFFLNLNQMEPDALTMLVLSLDKLEKFERLTLINRNQRLMLAQVSYTGSIYEALQKLPHKPLLYAEITTSFKPLPNNKNALEIIRCDFEAGKSTSIAADELKAVDVKTRDDIAGSLNDRMPDFDMGGFDDLLAIFVSSNEEYVSMSPPERVARVMETYLLTQQGGGVSLQVEHTKFDEYRVSFGVTNPPHSGFLSQVLEIFQRLNIGLKRSYSLDVTNGFTHYFLGTFYVKPRDNSPLKAGTPLYHNLQLELYNTQIVSPGLSSYTNLITNGIMSGPDATFITALIGFCHTNLAHNAPEVYERDSIVTAFHHNASMCIALTKLFYARFDPDLENREEHYAARLVSTTEQVENFNSGRRTLDNYRRVIFRCALSFIRHCLKTNFFVIEKHALAFRLDPAYLEELDTRFTEDLPAERPFRITFFSGRRGNGYHIGFSDIARGGWRTLITQNLDDYTNNASTLFKENYVLAHTQHLKNKDIYEGGSKLVAILNIDPRTTAEQREQYLYKLQHAFANAFLDLFITDENGHAKDPRVVDYYRQEEPIELGPDENMHNVMIERIAKLAERRGYLLGKGIMSSKEIGINHKEYGVTSIGVIRFAEVTMQEFGMDMHNSAFSVKFTGGPNGDVAGNGMRLLLERCPQVQIKLIVDGTGAVYDPEGLDKTALASIVLKDDVEGYDPNALHSGGYILYRMITRKEGISDLYRKVTRTDDGLKEDWVSTDNFYQAFNSLIFTVKTDLFIPAGGRPETIDDSNVERYFDAEGNPASKIIVEGANSFITPNARDVLQHKGVVIMRDASANKCGVISSSYEIIANLMFSDEEFLANKNEYVKDVIAILNQMAETEARSIIRRHTQLGGSMTYTDISSLLSQEINKHYARMFDYFQDNPEQISQPTHQQAMLKHMPVIIQNSAKYSQRINRLPEKVKYAILASKLASAMVYADDGQSLYADIINAQLKRVTA